MKPNDNRQPGPIRPPTEVVNTDTQLVKEKRQSEKLQKERDKAQLDLKTEKDENEKLRKIVKDFEERLNRLEAQSNEKAPPPPPPPPTISQASTLPPAQTNTAYQPHQMNQATRLAPTYPTHSTDRSLNHGQAYATQLAANAAGKIYSKSMISKYLTQSKGHAGRGQMYHGTNQAMVPRWPNGPFMNYQQSTDNNLWNAPHMPSQLR